MSQDTGINDSLAEFVGKRARELARNGAFAQLDWNDIEQMIWVRMLEKNIALAPTSEAEIGYVKQAIRNIGLDLIDHMDTKKEAFHRECVSLEADVDEDEQGLATTLGDRLEDPKPGPVEELSFAEAKNSFLSSLSDGRRELMDRLESKSQREVAAELNMPYSSLRHFHITPIQRLWKRVSEK